jgi:hypothetical protein
MKTPLRFRSSLEPLEARIAPALLTTLTWQGDLATAGWDDGTLNTNTNWLSNLGGHKIPADGNILVFPSTPAGGKTNTNDIAGLDLKSLTFTGDGYNIGGQAITLSGGVTANYATNGTDSFLAKITLAADQKFTFAGNTGAQFNFGQIDLGGKTLTIDNSFNVRIAANATNLTGTGALIKDGTGILNLVAGDFSGPVQANAGVLTMASLAALGATGPGNGTTIASGASLVVGQSGGTSAEDFTISGTGAGTIPSGTFGAAMVLGSQSNGAFTFTGALRLGADARIGGDITGGGASITLAGAVGAADDALAILTLDSAAFINGFAFANTAIFTTELAGTTPGAGGHDQLKITGPVNLGGATLNVVPSFAAQIGDKFTIVDNDGSDAITGTFAGLPEGTVFAAGGVNFKISYKGADASTGNDVVLTVDSLVQVPVNVNLSLDGKTATFTDRDGDLVTVKTNKGPFQQTDFRVIQAGVGGQLQLINLTTHAADFTGANLTITAKPAALVANGPLLGNGFVNLGYINANGIDLGTVSLPGDLGRIAAGTVGGDVKVPGVKSLTVESIGLLGTSTQDTNGNLVSKIEGALPTLLVKGDVRDADVILIGTDGKFGTVTLGGSLVGTAGGGGSFISAGGGIGTVKIGGDIRAASTTEFTGIVTARAMGAVTVGGGIEAAEGARLIEIFAFGQVTAPASGMDLAIKSLTVGGSVKNFLLKAGLNDARNADASIGSVTVGGDWIASSILAGMAPGADNRNGTTDDVKVLNPGRDNPAIFSTISSITIKGQALGTTAAGDMFGIVAEHIGRAKIGGRTFAFKADTATVQNHEAFFAAPTGPGKGATGEVLPFDFTIRELGSATPAPAFAIGLDTSKGNIATYTDVDGDLVTVKRSVGTFVAGDFDLVADPNSGGGQLRKLTITAAPTGAPVTLTITAKPAALVANGPLFGNGFVNVGEIDATGVAMGAVTLAGDVGRFNGGVNATAGKPGTASFSAHSIGVLGTATGAPDLQSLFSGGGVGRLTVAADVRDALIFTSGTGDRLGSVTIGGALVDSNASGGGFIQGGEGTGSVKIGGSVRGGSIGGGAAGLGAVTIGGDLIGDGGPTIFAFVDVLPNLTARSLDVALKSLTVRGSVENARLEFGTQDNAANADATVGAISVGRAWSGSSLIVGVDAGPDGFFGTSDDTKATGTLRTRDNPLVGGAPRFSTIASVVIKGQALGTTTAGDSFGIVAEQILSAKVGARTFKFDRGERDVTDAFALSPTGPGPAPDNAASDFFLREITH